ncbi:MAG: BTAD domain-containing putative transcriptional regulator [Solirubrobacteraceae bacterium]
MVEFRLLGPLEAVVDGVPVVLGPPQQRAVLALLLLNANEVVSRDRIVDELWGERPPATAAKLVQVYVSALRKLLDPDRRLLLTRPPGYLLRVEPEGLDLQRFERLVGQGRAALAEGSAATAGERFHEALALWRGPALADLAFAPFAQAEIGRLEDRRLDAVCDRIEADLALGRGGVVGELEALVAEHPLRERLRGQLMLALYRSGRQAEALAAYQDARRALVDGLGLEPGRELRELEQAILRQDPGLDLATPAEPEPDPARNTFVGREHELSTVMGALDEALAGDGRLVLIAGEPGIGKSRLAEEVGRHARRRGARVYVGRCWEAGGAPAYWPWVQALRAYIRDTDPEAVRAQLGGEGAELAAILPELRAVMPDLQESPPADSDGARFRLLESVASFLRNAASAGPVVIGLDDLHAADAPSLLLLRFVAGQLAAAPILIVGCYRDTEVGPELSETLADVAREPGMQRLALRGLSGSDTSRLLHLTMGDAPPDELAAAIHADTQGNPLFAKEIGRLLAAEGHGDGAPDGIPIPQGVLEVIGQRLARQSESCRNLLALASVVGREFDPDVIGRVAEVDEDALFAALDEAAGAGLVGAVPEASGRLRFAHILIRDALYEDLPAPRRLRLHRAVAEALEALYAGNPEPHLTELARHYREAGPAAAQKAIEYAQRAGDRAAAQYGYEEAAQSYTSALEMLETARAGDSDRTCELLLSLGEVQSRAGHGAEAREALRKAAELAQEADRPDQLARAAIEYGGRFGWARASIDPFYVPVLERALAAVGTEDSSARVRLLARLAAARRDDAPRERRVAIAAEGLEMAARIGDPVTLALALEAQWVATEGPEMVRDGTGLAATRRMIELGEQAGDKERMYEGHEHRLNSFWQLGDRTAVDVEFDALAALAEELRQPAQRWHIGTMRTMLALMEGRFEDAERLIEETVVLGKRVERWNAVVSQRIALFLLRREQGRLGELATTIGRSVHEYPSLLRFACAQAHLEADLGREREARAHLDGLLALDLEREHRDAEWLFSMALLADPCGWLAHERGAAKLYPLLLPFEQLYAVAPIEGSFGAMARGLGVLATVLRRYDDADRHLEAAIDIERRMGGRPGLAHAHHDLAIALLARGARGDRQRAEEHRDAALGTYRELGMETWAARAYALR